MGKFEDLTDRTFGRLTVIGRAPDRVLPSGQHKTMWWCKCSCGNPELKAIDAYSLTHCKTESCGCIQKETASKIFSNPNDIDLSGDYGIGYTSNGERFFFDLEDYEKIKGITWFICSGNMENYVAGHDNNGKIILMHRLVMDYDGPYDIDHKHGKETRNDNRKCNLRIATRSQNNANSNDTHSNTGVLGVHKLKGNGKFRAYIQYNGKQVRLGDFKNIEDAIDARKKAEIEYFKEWGYDVSQYSDPEYFNPNERS